MNLQEIPAKSHIKGDKEQFMKFLGLCEQLYYGYRTVSPD